MNAKCSHPFRLAVLATAATLAAMLTGCNEPLSQTPEEDTTMLWPAADSTGYWGFINEQGEMVIPAKYDRTYGFSGGVAQVYIDVDGKPLDKYAAYQTSIMGPRHAFINKKGEIVYTLPENKGFADHYFYYGACRYWSRPFWGIEPYGMLDSRFSSIIADDQPVYTLGVMTKDGLASSDIGYFNKKGEKVISRYINGVDGELYFLLHDFCDGIAVVTTYNGANGAINTKGELVIDTTYYYLRSVGNDRLIYQLLDGNTLLTGMMDTRGNKITELNERATDSFCFFGDGELMPARNNEGMYGYIDKNGTLRIPYQFAEALPFYNGYAWVWKPTTAVMKSTEVTINLYCLINLQGEVVLPLDTWQQMPASHISSGAHNGLCLIVDEEDPKFRVYKYINLKGEVIYSWSEESNRQGSNAPAAQQLPILDPTERILRLFEGTKYYPLAEQCVRNRHTRTGRTEKD